MSSCILFSMSGEYSSDSRNHMLYMQVSRLGIVSFAIHIVHYTAGSNSLGVTVTSTRHARLWTNWLSLNVLMYEKGDWCFCHLGETISCPPGMSKLTTSLPLPIV